MYLLCLPLTLLLWVLELPSLLLAPIHLPPGLQGPPLLSHIPEAGPFQDSHLWPHTRCPLSVPQYACFHPPGLSPALRTFPCGWDILLLLLLRLGPWPQLPAPPFHPVSARPSAPAGSEAGSAGWVCFTSVSGGQQPVSWPRSGLDVVGSFALLDHLNGEVWIQVPAVIDGDLELSPDFLLGKLHKEW